MVIVLENTIDYVASVIPKFFKEYPESCRVHIYKSTPLSVISRLNQPPLLSVGWLVLVEDQLKDEAYKRLDSQKSNLVVIVEKYKSQGNKRFNQLQQLGINVQVIDNLVPPKEEVQDFVMGSLNITSTNAKRLVTRFKGDLPKLIENVDKLSILEKVTWADIEKYTTKREIKPIYTVGEWLLGLPSKASFEQVIKVIYQYRFGFGYLVKYLRGLLNQYYIVFKFVDSGELSMKNYVQFKQNTDEKIIKDMSDFELYTIIHNYSIVSMQKLIFLKDKLSQMRYDPFESYKLISLIKLNER